MQLVAWQQTDSWWLRTVCRDLSLAESQRTQRKDKIKNLFSADSASLRDSFFILQLHLQHGLISPHQLACVFHSMQRASTRRPLFFLARVAMGTAISQTWLQTPQPRHRVKGGIYLAPPAAIYSMSLCGGRLSQNADGTRTEVW